MNKYYTEIKKEKRFKLFNKAIDYFITLGFEIKSVHLFNDIINLVVYRYMFQIRMKYTLIIYDTNFTIYYIRTNTKRLKWYQKEISNNYKIK